MRDVHVHEENMRSHCVRNVAGLLLVMAIGSFIYCIYRYSQVEQYHSQDTGGWSPERTMQIKQGDVNHAAPRKTSTGYSTKPDPAQFSIPLNTKILDYFGQNKSIHKELSNQVTVVTMYFNIGQFQKGASDTFTPDLYRRWMKTFSVLQNPVVAFFDNLSDKEYFDNIRRRLGTEMTKTFLVDRSQMWAFDLRDSISKIFNQRGYPQHHPNTVVPDYSCAMHAKYEIMAAMTRENIFNTQYFAWLDIGLFRSEAMSDGLPFYEIWLPPNFNSSQVAYTEVAPRQTRSTPQSIVYANAVWVCGAFFIGQVNTMLELSEQYMRTTQAMITIHKLMSTDQQVLYVLYNWGHPEVGVQTYRTDDPKYNAWFYLGYLCKEQGDKKRQGLLDQKLALNQ